MDYRQRCEPLPNWIPFWILYFLLFFPSSPTSRCSNMSPLTCFCVCLPFLLHDPWCWLPRVVVSLFGACCLVAWQFFGLLLGCNCGSWPLRIRSFLALVVFFLFFPPNFRTTQTRRRIHAFIAPFLTSNTTTHIYGIHIIIGYYPPLLRIYLYTYHIFSKSLNFSARIINVNDNGDRRRERWPCFFIFTESVLFYVCESSETG